MTRIPRVALERLDENLVEGPTQVPEQPLLGPMHWPHDAVGVVILGPRKKIEEHQRLIARKVDHLNRTDSGGDSIVWRNMESWQTMATTASGGIHPN